jgi:hypothetical protein
MTPGAFAEREKSRYYLANIIYYKSSLSKLRVMHLIRRLEAQNLTWGRIEKLHRALDRGGGHGAYIGSLGDEEPDPAIAILDQSLLP